MEAAWRLLVTVSAALGLLMLVVTFTPLDKWWVERLSGQWNRPQGEVLIVLGGAGPSDNVIGYSSYLRAQYAVDAYRENHFRLVLITGGGGDVPAALTMRNFMVSQGVPDSVVRIETASTSTRENALYSKPMLNGFSGKKMLLSSDFHIYRAQRVFEKVGIAVVSFPAPDAAKQAETFLGRWSAFVELARETIKIIYYRARGWM